MVMTANQETNINCSGKVGRDEEEKNKTAIDIEFSSQVIPVKYNVLFLAVIEE